MRNHHVTLTAEQSQIAKEFVESYGLNRQQIFFEGTKPEPWFDGEALNYLATILGDFRRIDVSPGKANQAEKYVLCSCEVELADGRVRKTFGICELPDQLPDGSKVENLLDAFSVAGMRATRRAFQYAGFDPYRIHRQLHGQPDAETTGVSGQRKRELAEIHILGRELGWIQEGDERTYREMLFAFFAVDSAADLSAEQRQQFIDMMRGRLLARDKNQTAAQSSQTATA